MNILNAPEKLSKIKNNSGIGYDCGHWRLKPTGAAMYRMAKEESTTAAGMDSCNQELC